jgi:hypothetical protein
MKTKSRRLSKRELGLIRKATPSQLRFVVIMLLKERRAA